MATDLFSGSSLSSNAMATRWLTEEVFKLIDMVQKEEAIYNPRHRHYFCRPYVENFWREVDIKLEKNSGASLAKWTNLRISFRREYTNYLEEKVAPCWTYFHRMFFLHPFLRRKQQSSTKSLDQQFQDATDQINIMSQRFRGEGLNATTFTSPTSSGAGPGDVEGANGSNTVSPRRTRAGNYLEYIDEAGQNNTELLDELIDEDYSSAIKLEGQDSPDEYETLSRPAVLGERDNDLEVSGSANLSMHAISSSTTDNMTNSNNLRRPHQAGPSARPYDYEEEPTTTKRSRPSIHLVSTTTAGATLKSSDGEKSKGNNDNDKQLNWSSTSSPSAMMPLPTMASSSFRNQFLQHNPTYNQQQQQRVTLPSIGIMSNLVTDPQSPLQPAARAATLPHNELCECKTDPDAMFLMSLLPDIQKLHGRDRGKIKIAFQNILQNFLYPE